MDDKEKNHLFGKPRNVKLLIHALYVGCAVLMVLDIVIHRHVEHPLESWFGFYGFYGFVCCFFLVVAATWMRKIVMRKEDYYDE